MQPKATLATVLLSLPVLTSTALAQAPAEPPTPPLLEVRQTALTKENSVNLSPLGILSGSYGLNYERLLNGYHGLIVEGNFSSFSDSDSSSSSFGGALGYRFHWRGNQNSGFLGLNVGYYNGTGTGSVSTNSGQERTFDVDTSVASITANIGKRWAWDSGLNITFRIGAGKGYYDITTDSDDPDAQKAVKAVDDLLTVFPIAFDGELSVGYIF